MERSETRRATRPRPATAACRAGIGSDRQEGAVVPPLYLSSNFTFRDLGRQREYDYTRSGNPTRALFASALAELEGGCGAEITASGMAAVTLACQLLEPGDLLLAPHDCYGGTYRLFAALGRRGVFRVVFVDQTSERALRRALELGPRLVWIETPSNPLLRIVDIAAVAERARAAGALVAVDNTFLSPVRQRPLELGADLVVHSTTKYLNGHSDVVGGAVVAADPEVHGELAQWCNWLGLAGAPFDSFLSLRGLRTLSARWRCHEENTAAVVELLGRHPVVDGVLWPGLPEHEGHEIARRQQAGYGAMVAFRLLGGSPAVRAFVRSLRCFSLAESLGGVESLVAHPATMTHASMPEEARRRAGIGDDLLRLSVGIEDAADLVEDLDGALEAALAAADRAVAAPPVPAHPETYTLAE